MATINLDRRFVDWRDGELSDPDSYVRFVGRDRTLSWADLLKKRGVVVPAEAGSGKTEEIEERAPQHFALRSSSQLPGGVARVFDQPMSECDNLRLARWKTHPTRKRLWARPDVCPVGL